MSNCSKPGSLPQNGHIDPTFCGRSGQIPAFSCDRSKERLSCRLLYSYSFLHNAGNLSGSATYS
ncbi:hypothetical protein OU5_0319 [Pseudomonas mandelii JR-1]|uniref:Uncharacterized protein n=1 Tax=Pseudomonas mandelii JR-1 TaxID=1147786 RepID=A0A024E4Z7_9PSED|nr:hypothetical protein OU5_0319 [Pseudomonas mandelii JR-1]